MTTPPTVPVQNDAAQQPPLLKISEAQRAALQRWLAGAVPVPGGHLSIWQDETLSLFALGGDVGLLMVTPDGGLPSSFCLPSSVCFPEAS